MGRMEDILLIIAVGLLLFGPHKMVDFAKSLGGALNEFKKAANPESQTSQPQPQPQAPVMAATVATAPRRRKTVRSRSKSKKAN